MDAADEKLVAEIRSWGDRASNAERRLALAEACVEAARPFRLEHWRGPLTPEGGVALCTQVLAAKLAAYDWAKGTGSGLSPAAKAGEHLQSPEPAPRMVTLATAKEWCEEMQANCGRMNERVPLPSSLLAALEEEAKGRVSGQAQAAGTLDGASDVLQAPSPEQPAQVCAHPGVMRRCEWLTGSGGVPARIYCQSCGQTLYPPAATPAVPVNLETRCPDCGAVIPAHRCGATPAVPAETFHGLQLRHDRMRTLAEVEALLEGLRERCMQAACDGVHRNLGCAEMTGRVRDVNLWPVTEPERKER